mmetsp:Transcript_47713/g.80079  ORF Transcript_47713/g.80079 Transcript_47713/m.80079 type:complete len:221 (+) Transcript_47713:95-757(+)
MHWPLGTGEGEGGGSPKRCRLTRVSAPTRKAPEVTGCGVYWTAGCRAERASTWGEGVSRRARSHRHPSRTAEAGLRPGPRTGGPGGRTRRAAADVCAAVQQLALAQQRRHLFPGTVRPIGLLNDAHIDLGPGRLFTEHQLLPSGLFTAHDAFSGLGLGSLHVGLQIDEDAVRRGLCAVNPTRAECARVVVHGGVGLHLGVQLRQSPPVLVFLRLQAQPGQ